MFDSVDNDLIQRCRQGDLEAYKTLFDRFEQQAQAKLAQLEPDLSYLYRDKLATIDEQIALCQEAIAENPANSHVRRYLFAALQEKRDTLGELMAYRPPVQ